MSTNDPHHRPESGDTCPACLDGRLTIDGTANGWRLICPRCCHTER